MVDAGLIGGRTLWVDVLFVRFLFHGCGRGLGIRFGAVGGGFGTARLGCCFRHRDGVLGELSRDWRMKKVGNRLEGEGGRREIYVYFLVCPSAAYVTRDRVRT